MVPRQKAMKSSETNSPLLHRFWSTFEDKLPNAFCSSSTCRKLVAGCFLCDWLVKQSRFSLPGLCDICLYTKSYKRINEGTGGPTKAWEGSHETASRKFAAQHNHFLNSAIAYVSSDQQGLQTEHLYSWTVLGGTWGWWLSSSSLHIVVCACLLTFVQSPLVPSKSKNFD